MAASSATNRKSPWLHAHYDKLAGVRAYSSGVALVDTDGSGESALVVADHEGSRVRIFRGLKQSSVPLPPESEVPAAICGFFMEGKKNMAIGVASGSSVYVFRNLRPFCKYEAPPAKLDGREISAWEEKEPDIVQKLLKEAHEDGALLSSRSLVTLRMQKDELRQHVIEHRPFAAKGTKDTVITCMTSMNKAHDGSTSCLILGTESRNIIVLHSKMNTGDSHTLCEIALPAVPSLLATTGGSYDLDDWRIVVACRDSAAYTLAPGDKKGAVVVRKPRIEFESQIVGMVLQEDKYAYFATADSVIHCYLLTKSRRVYSKAMDHPVTNLELFRTGQDAFLLVALANGDIRCYRDGGKNLVDVLRVNERITALTSGTYGREENALIIITGSGSLLIKMLPRTAEILERNAAATAGGGPPPEQDVPLDIPKKTRLYLDQTDREREKAPDIYRAFQKDVLKLKITTAEAYLSLQQQQGLLPTAENAPATGSSESSGAATSKIDLTARVNGLGPFFHVVVQLRIPHDAQPLHDLPVVVVYDPERYRMPHSSTSLPMLVPGLATHSIFEIESIDDETQKGDEDAPSIVISVLQGSSSCTPLAASTLIMPRSETLE